MHCIHPRPLYLMLPLLACAVSFLCGCGEGHPPTYTVQGKVVFSDGSPVPGGMIMFRSGSVAGSVFNATGIIQDDGSFQMTTFKPNDGAVAGVHQVIVQEAAPNIDFQSPAAAATLIDPRYSRYETSGLQVTVEEQDNDFTIEVGPPKRPKR